VKDKSEPSKDSVGTKLPYNSPRLTDYGSVSELTEAKSANMTDNTASDMHND
jgi:hypothetical protein